MSFGQFQFRRDTAANWTSANPTLLSGEMGIETDTNKFKIGNGTSAWTALAYGGIQGAAGSGVPTGGTLNQILAKNSSTDFDDAWKTFDDTIHSTRGGGTLHAAVTTSTAGFMSSADKTKINAGYKDIVSEFGADPTGSVDATTIIQTAVDSFSSTGGRLYFPAGTYKMSNTVTISKPIIIFGAGRAISNITMTHATANQFTMASGAQGRWF